MEAICSVAAKGPVDPGFCLQLFHMYLITYAVTANNLSMVLWRAMFYEYLTYLC